jgi:hypothetical protein
VRVPTGVLDHELRVVVHLDDAAPRVEVQSWHYSLSAGAWVQASEPPTLEARFAERLAEVLLAAAPSVAPDIRADELDSSPVRIPLAADLELRLAIVVAEDGQPAVEVGHWRASPNDTSRQFHRTAAAWRVPSHLFPLALAGMQKIGARLTKLSQRATERRLFAPAAGSEP